MVSREKLRQKIVDMIDKMDQYMLDMLDQEDGVCFVFEEPSSNRMYVMTLRAAVPNEPAIPAEEDNL